MSEVIELAKKIKDELDSLPLFKEFEKLKEEIKRNKELCSLELEIKKSTKDKTRNKELLEKYNCHPLIVNFKNVEGEVKDYLREIANIINKK